jgi:hypothetical protein
MAKAIRRASKLIGPAEPTPASDPSTQDELTELSTLSRADLVGKYPHIQHWPAPKGPGLLSQEQHHAMLAAMRLP